MKYGALAVGAVALGARAAMGNRGRRAGWRRASDAELEAMSALRTQTYLGFSDLDTIQGLISMNLIKRISGTGAVSIPCPPGCIPDPNRDETLSYPQYELTWRGREYLKMHEVP